MKNTHPSDSLSDSSQPRSSGISELILSECSSDHAVARYELANTRIPIVDKYLHYEITAKEACKILGMKLSGFYKIVRRVKAAGGDLNAVIAGVPGRRNVPVEFQTEIEQLIADAMKAYRGKAATYACVWRKAQVLARERGLKCPSYYSIRRRLKLKGERFLAKMRLGRSDAADIYEARPGYKSTKRPLELVQIDHTLVDLIVVDENDRQVICRPWVSFAICVYTRAILGFYLSLLPPNAISVAMLIESCALPKTNMLASMGLHKISWQMYGLPETLHADNAPEFKSKVLKANLQRFGIEVEHRDVGKKHQGGHIERLIGTMMKGYIHFLRGTTYSNVQQRGGENSEGRAVYTISELRKAIVCYISAYNNSKHSSIHMSPAEKWDKYYLENKSAPRRLDESQHQNFRYALFPEKKKIIRSGGIEMHSRFYYEACLQNRVRDELTVKFDPNDLSYILADIEGNGQYVKIPECRNECCRSSDYAVYRAERQQRGLRDGTYSPEGIKALEYGEEIAKEEYRKTARSKRKAAREAGKRDQKNFTESLEFQSKTVNSDSISRQNPKGLSAKSSPRLRVIEGCKAAPKKLWRDFSEDDAALKVDFDVPPKIY